MTTQAAGDGVASVGQRNLWGETMLRLLIATATSALVVFAAHAADTADSIWSGGPIYTMDDALPKIDAVAVKDGRNFSLSAPPTR